MSRFSPSTKSKKRKIRYILALSTTALIMIGATKMLRSIPSCSAFSSTGLKVFATKPYMSSMQLDMIHSSRTKISYSEATKTRIKGLDASKEFQKLAIKMKKPPKELRVILTKRLSSSTATTEKEEYVDWLLSGIKSDVIPPPKKKAPNPAPATNVTNKKTQRAISTKIEEPAVSTGKQTFQTDVRFDDEDKIELHWNSRKAVAQMGLTHMTEIQSKTFAAASAGKDVLGRARTGTGKTVAFLLPAIERLVRDGTINDPNTVGILVVSPTRELASQIGEQAKQLLQYHQGTSVQVIFGGTKIKTDVNRLSSRKGLPTVLVATPGRLLDHLKSTKLTTNHGNNLVSFGKHVMPETNLLVLDETDRLLDMGFRREINKILEYLPSSHTRQTLLFSATMPPDLKTIMKQNMKPDYVEVDCVQDGDAATHTNDRVTQSHVVLPSKGTDMISSVVETVRYAVETHVNEENDSSRFTVPPKIVVFFPTARLVQFYAEIFQEITKGVLLTTDTGDGKPIQIPSWELHSKKTQGYRNRVSEEFRKATVGVLFTSDVSARGVDYPNVSHVIQFGMPENREQYIHRLGRTGRGGSKGTGWLVLQDWESAFLGELKGVNIPQNEDLVSRVGGISADSDAVVQEVRRRVRGGDGILSKSGSAAYAAFLGYYKGQMKRMRMKQSEILVGIANDFALSSGFKEPPKLQKSTVSKMGLKNVPGLNIGNVDFGDRGGGGRGGGGRGNGRGGGRGRGSGRGGGRKSQPGRGGRDSDGRRFRQTQSR